MRLVPLLLATALVVAAAPPVRAQAPKGSLDFVPSTAGGFVTVKVSDLMTLESLKPVREAIARIEKLEGNRFGDLFGVSWDEIDRVTVFWPAPIGTGDEPPEPFVVVGTKAPFNEARVLKALRAVPPGDRHGRRPGAARAPEPPPVKTEVRGASPPPPPPPPPPKFERPGTDGAQQGPARGGPAKEPAPAAGSGDRPDLYYLEKEPFSAVYLLDDRTLFFLTDENLNDGLLPLVGQLLRRKADGPLAAALAEADKHTVVAATRLRLDLVGREPGELPRDLVPFRTLFKTQLATLTADIGPKSAATVRLTFADADTARRAEPVLKTLFQTGVDALTEAKKGEAKRDADWGTILEPLFDLAIGALDKADVKTDGMIVSARVEAETGPALAKFAATLPDRIEEVTIRMKTANNLKQIGLAVHNYHDVHNALPTDVVGPDGKALLSWRVQLLPYLEQDNLFKQLDMTKAWDDPRNAKLLAKMPDVFRVHGRDAKDKTYLQMPTAGPGNAGIAPFHVIGRRTTFASITDGLSNTLMVVEAADAVDWAKPGDLVFDPDKLPALGDPARKRFHALLGDGSVRMIHRDIDRQVLKALFTVNGGETAMIPD
jgi:hypothetical protein